MHVPTMYADLDLSGVKLIYIELAKCLVIRIYILNRRLIGRIPLPPFSVHLTSYKRACHSTDLSEPFLKYIFIFYRKTVSNII